MKQLLIISLLFIATVSFGQEDRVYADGVSLNGHLQMAIPQDGYTEVLSGAPAGASLSLVLPSGRTGLFKVGLEAAWMSGADQDISTRLASPSGGVFFGETDRTIKTQHYLAKFRLSPFKGSVRPYGEVIVGARSYDMTTEISVPMVDGNTLRTMHQFQREFHSTYGYSGGLQIAIGRNAFIDANVQVLRGGPIRTLDPNSLRVSESTGISYDLFETRTEVLVPRIGLTLSF